MIFKTWLFPFLLIQISTSSNVLYFDKYNPIISKINEKFLSIGLDTSVIQNGFKKFNMSWVNMLLSNFWEFKKFITLTFRNPKLVKMISHLSPAYLRVGGNMADRLIFVPNGENLVYNSNYSGQMQESCEEYCTYVSTQNFSMHGKYGYVELTHYKQINFLPRQRLDTLE